MNKIFLIDDDEDDQLFFKEAVALINSTLQCDTAKNGKIALDKLKESETLPDIIFLDLNMPIMNGFDFLVQVKKENNLKNIPIGIFSTSNTDTDKQKAKEFGAQFFLTKPNDFKLLLAKIEQVISSNFAEENYVLII